MSFPFSPGLPNLCEMRVRLERLRTLGGISARALSILVGASPNTVRNIETSRSLTPRGDVLVALAQLLGTSVEYLALGMGEEPTEEQVKAALARAGFIGEPPREGT